ncbi:McrC family protein, partial [Frankia casuarinae]
PKVTIRRLLFLLGYAQDRGRWFEDEVQAAEEPDLLPAVAAAFARTASRALAHGVPRGYRQVDAALPVLRGRLRESAQLRQRSGVMFPLEVRYDERTVDTAENRLLLAATRSLLALAGVAPATAQELRRIAAALDGVAEPAHGPVKPPDWVPTRVNAPYHAALRLAETVLRSSSFEREDGETLRVDGFVVKMWEVFEDFVTHAVDEVLTHRGGEVRLQDRTHHLDEDRTLEMCPDLVLYRPEGPGGRMIPAVVLDAKYRLAIRQGARAHVYHQMIAYCARLGARQGWLVYAGSERADGQPGGRGDVIRSRIGGPTPIGLVTYVLDLRLPLAELRARIERIADDMVTPSV